MFRHLSGRFAPDTRIVGGSWLYNVDAYRALFPPDYLATAQVGPAEYQFMALWGQFLDRRGDARQPATRALLDRLAQPPGAGGPAECFPYQVLRLESALGPMREFYERQ